jgi:hypothetical protein
MRNYAFAALAVSSIAIAVAASAPAYAQETTSAVSGKVTSDTGAPVPGAKVTVVHVPSGTTATSTTDGSGTFSLRGLRVGGPYTVTVDAAGFGPQTVEGLSLTLGETLAVPVQLGSREIVVTGARTGSRRLVEGSESSFNSSQIASIVSARRDVRDIVRRDLLASYNPNVGGVSIAGGNIRTQRFSVDGVQMQDSFGLNYGGLPSTRGIVSLEAIDQLTVKAAPFDISEGNFQGGAVNVVLKSGTNHFHITAFGNWGGPNLTGNLTHDNRILPTGTLAVRPSSVLDFTNFGGSLSGPIIKDKLFFSAAYEKLTEGSPNTYGVTGGSAANVVPNLTQAQVDDVISRFNSAGYDKYNVGNVPAAIAEKDIKYSGKLDWNVMEGQRVSISYIHHQNALPNYAVGSGSATGSNSSSTPYIQLQSNLYQITEFTNAGSGQWNSQWTDKLSSEVRVAYKYYRRGQDAFFGPDYAQFNVCLDPTSSATLYPNTAATLCNTGSPIIRMGPDTPRQANKFNNKQLTISVNMQYKAGDHNFKLEYDRMHSRNYNLFVYGGTAVSAGSTAGGSGAYYFDSLSDFSARDANELALESATTGNKNDGYVDWAYTTHTVGLQDTWKPSPRFTANFGLRYDFYASDDAIAYNQNFINRYSALYPGITNTATLNGRTKLQPRFGFNWAPEPTLRFSGGAGLFSGGLSDVFISNNYSNSGAAINSTGAALTSIDILRTGGTLAAPTCLDRANPSITVSSAVCTAALTNIAGGAIPQVVIDYLKSAAGVSPLATTNSLDPHFKMPAQWKANLSGSWKPELGDSLLASGWTFRADALFSKTQEGIRWIDLRAQPLVIGGVTQVGPDGRPRYGGTIAGVQPGGNSDIQLTNTTKGRSWVFAVGVIKDLGDLNLMASYTHQNVKDVAGVLVSSTVSSSYGIPTSDPNSGGDYGRSQFEVTHTIRANVDFHHKFFGDNETRFGINWELRSGQPFSAVMFDSTTNGTSGRAAVFGTVNTSSHLFYVPDFTLTPTNNGLTYGIITFADQATMQSVKALVQGTSLSKYQGKISPKDLLTGPWYNKVDLNFAQQVPFFFHSKITALFSIENFLNLLNRNWGSYADYGTSATIVRVACNGATTNGQTCPGYTYSTYSAPTTTTYAKPSLYAIRAGVRFDF